MASFPPLLSSTSTENDQSDDMRFDIADYLNLDEETQEKHRLAPLTGEKIRVLPKINDENVYRYHSGDCSRHMILMNSSSRRCFKVAFRTKSDTEIMDDGYRWRKYGKKMVKSSPNPRNYFRCSNVGCNVKKRVEREREDWTYVITTYEGVHNHHAPPVKFYPDASEPSPHQ